MIRIPQQNDWVVFLLIGCIFLYVFMLRSLKRDSSVLEFLLQKFPDSANNFLSGIIISLVFSLVFSALISPNIPVVPKFVTDYRLLGYELNKFGFTFMVVTLYYILRTILSYLFFAGTSAGTRWELFSFVASKFYFCFSVVLMVFCVLQFYFPLDREVMLQVFFYSIIALFSGKLLYYIFHKDRVLPQKWYYKFLYICTLQIIPVLVLWKLLFI
ncbi:DUF4271 domain-containing protein [Chryseobacterium sp. 6424]|uniref:DUF4271 domain-containing protein n=1 Tax=Chryseobacterium sp. 6424 TaxID=2039166 RepID=UPI001E36E896|nr:DUF4271 domain-containing protein [Chryseobacterium sp. 6424]